MGFVFAAELRRQLSACNLEYSKTSGLSYVESYGEVPVIVYAPSEDGRTHGNFHPLSYGAIVANSAWARRLGKPHSQAARALPKTDRRWMELDSSTSSDALLMNIFTFPAVAKEPAVLGMLGLDEAAVPEFGLKARVPQQGGRVDRTEVDMKIGSLLVESKLTESDFQCKDKQTVESYRDFDLVFNKRALASEKGSYLSYQLIRNVLAAYALEMSFCVFLDQRRPDLIEAWYSVMKCVRIADLRLRCKVLTWQELSAVLPEDLQQFLRCKYGIEAPWTASQSIEPVHSSLASLRSNL